MARHLLLRQADNDRDAGEAVHDAAWLAMAHRSPAASAATKQRLRESGAHAARRRASQSIARLLLTVWGGLLLLPEEARAIVIEDVLMALTILVSLSQELIYEVQSHLKVSAAIGAGVVALLTFLCCRRTRKLRWLKSLEPSGADPNDIGGRADGEPKSGGMDGKA